MRKRHRKPLLVLIGLLVSAGAALLFLREMRGQWGAMVEALGRADYAWLLPALGFTALVYVLRVVRWRVFLAPIRAVPYGEILSATMIGFMANALLPLRPGEVVRPYVLHRKSGLSFGHAAGTAMGLERVFDLVGACFLVALALGALFGGGEAAALGPEVLRRAWGFAALAGLALIVLTVAAFVPHVVVRGAQFVLGALPAGPREGLLGLVRSITDALGFVRRPWRVAAALALTLAIWACFPLGTWCVAAAFRLALPPAGVLTVQVLITLAVVPPQASGFIGLFQYAAVKGAGLFGVAAGEAGAFAMVLWALNIIPVALVGLGFLWAEGLNLRRLAHASEEAAEEPQMNADERG